MALSAKELKLDFGKSLLSSYASIAVMEVRMYNNNSSIDRPSYKELLYIYCIWSIENCTATDLVELFRSSKALVSQTIINMEKKGFIIRQKDPLDNRRQILRVSEEVIRRYNDEVVIIEEAIRRLSGTYTLEEICEASNVIKDITDCMLRISSERTALEDYRKTF